MRRLVLFAAMLGLPIAAAAQTPQTPPPAPPTPMAPQAVPVPVTPAEPPTTPRPSPMAKPAPVYIDQFEIDQAVRAAQAVRVDTEAIREQAREAAEQARRAMEDAKFDFKWDYKFDEARWAVQDKAFTFAQSGEGGYYDSGLSALNANQYEQAIVRFDRVIAQKTARTDAAMYHKAYAQFKLGRTAEAQETIALLRKDFPQSRYLNDAKVLEADAKRLKPEQITGQDDDDLKLLAINAMQYTDAERAVSALEGVLTANNSLKVKKRAVYVLAQINNPRAHSILLNYAKGAGNPDLQLEAIRYLAVNHDKQTTATELQQIYQSTQDTNVKLAIISAFRQSGNTPALVSIASTSGTPIAIRQSAVNGIAGIGGPQDLWNLYQKETDKDLRLQMVSAFGSMGALDQLSQILKTEKDAEVRRRAVRSLGNMRSEQTG
ncbi:MAG TPA: tetratricopeptide repeat protein, partial [Rhodanobacteraceae bacterium]